MIKQAMRILCATLVCCGPAFSAPPEETIKEHFTPADKGVELVYQISYHVLGLKLKRIGEARSFSIEGIWTDEEGHTTPAFYSEIRVDTRDDPDAEKRKRISVHNTMAAVLSIPDLQTLIYYKAADEYLNPFFKKPTHEHYLDFYALKSDGMDYQREDHTSGEKSDDLKHSEELLNEGNAFAEILKRMSAVYRGDEEPLTPDSDFRVFFMIEDDMKPFAAKSSRESLTVKPLKKKMETLCVEISQAPEAEGKSKTGNLTLWGIPFTELSKATGEAEIIELAQHAPDWSVIPVRINSKRPIGYIRCYLEAINSRTF